MTDTPRNEAAERLHYAFDSYECVQGERDELHQDLREALAAERRATEADLQEALGLLASVRDADVIFAKSDWHISQAITAFLAKHRKEQP